MRVTSVQHLLLEAWQVRHCLGSLFDFSSLIVSGCWSGMRYSCLFDRQAADMGGLASMVSCRQPCLEVEGVGLV